MSRCHGDAQTAATPRSGLKVSVLLQKATSRDAAENVIMAEDDT